MKLKVEFEIDTEQPVSWKFLETKLKDCFETSVVVDFEGISEIEVVEE